MMEDLIAGDIDLGLNIICNTNSTPSKAKAKRNNDTDIIGKDGKKRKFNKYEKRRYKTRMAKEAKERLLSLKDQNENKMEQKQDQQMMQENKVMKEEKELDFVSENVGSQEMKNMEKEKDMKQKDFNSMETKNIVISPIMDHDRKIESVDLNRKQSRRYHLKNELEEEEKRAAYMAEFHAHPKETDRRSNAERNIKLSTSSSHIFMVESQSKPQQQHNIPATKSKVNDDNDKDDMNEANIANKAKNHTTTTTTAKSTETNTNTHECPFMKFGLNECLSKAITSERGPFALSRPTVIQARALSLLLPSSSSNSTALDAETIANNAKQNVFVQSETGSGKTLAYLLPMLQSLLAAPTTATTATTATTTAHPQLDSPLHKGTNAKSTKDQRSNQTPKTLILLPTRELALQTYQTALKLTQSSKSLRNITSVCLSGGEKRKSEKARLRKGCSILIGTPGRILDHLQKTECLRSALSMDNQNNNDNIIAKDQQALQWLVLDEADRLLDMGLSGQVKHILQVLNSLCGDSWIRRGYGLRSVLVSATITEDMQTLARDLLGHTNSINVNCNAKVNDSSSSPWIWVSATKEESSASNATGQPTLNDYNNNHNHDNNPRDDEQKNINELPLANAAPRQLAQQHMIVSAKLRLPALVAFLMARVKQNQRVVVFMATCDGVDYHHQLFSTMDNLFMDSDSTTDKRYDNTTGLFGNACTFFRLHGNIPHSERHQIIRKFTNSTKESGSHQTSTGGAVLFATDVAARGLNIPGVDWIVQYDPPCEIADYIHRAGRTARAGKAGNALLFLLPSERQYMDVLDIKGLKGVNTALSLTSTLERAAELCPHLTKEGERRSGGSSRIGEAFAMTAQIKLEEFVIQDTVTRKQAMKKLNNEQNTKKKRREGKKTMTAIKEQEQYQLENGLQASAWKAFSSFLKAYPAKEKSVRHIFSTRALHLGHVARSFALKDPPKTLKLALKSSSKKSGQSKDSGSARDYQSNGVKRNANLAFKDLSKSNLSVKGNKSKRQKKNIFATNKDDLNDGESSERNFTETNRSKMMSTARKIQNGGMEFF